VGLCSSFVCSPLCPLSSQPHFKLHNPNPNPKPKNPKPHSQPHSQPPNPKSTDRVAAPSKALLRQGPDSTGATPGADLGQRQRGGAVCAGSVRTASEKAVQAGVIRATRSSGLALLCNDNEPLCRFLSLSFFLLLVLAHISVSVSWSLNSVVICYCNHSKSAGMAHSQSRSYIQLPKPPRCRALTTQAQLPF